MSDEAVTAVAVVDRGAQQPRHQWRNRGGILKLDQHVKVVAHQAIVIHPQAEPTLVAPEQTQEGVTVLVIGEDPLAVVAAVAEMKAGLAGPLAAARPAWHRGLPIASRVPLTLHLRVRFYLELHRFQVERHRFPLGTPPLPRVCVERHCFPKGLRRASPFSIFLARSNSGLFAAC
jgi:hypothetical protein